MQQDKRISERGSICKDDLEHIKTMHNAIEQEMNNIEIELQDMRRELEASQTILDQRDGQLKLLERFLESAGIEVQEGSQKKDKSKLHRTDWTKILNYAEQILRERNGEHMNFRSLYEELENRGVEITTKRPEIRLTQALAYDDRFVRPKRRGHYALREDYPDTRNVGERKNRKGAGDEDKIDAGGRSG